MKRISDTFSDAINTVYPETQVQLCIVHMVRNSIKYVPWKDNKPVTTDLKLIYQAVTEEEALLALDNFSLRQRSCICEPKLFIFLFNSVYQIRQNFLFIIY